MDRWTPWSGRTNHLNTFFVSYGTIITHYGLLSGKLQVNFKFKDLLCFLRYENLIVNCNESLLRSRYQFSHQDDTLSAA